MKRFLSGVVALFFMLLCPCAGADYTFARIEENTVYFMDAGYSLPWEDFGLKAQHYVGNRAFDYTVNCENAIVSVFGVEIDTVSTQSDQYRSLGIRPGKDYTLITISLEYENTGSSDIFLASDNAFVVTSRKEQVQENAAFAANRAGVLLSGAKKLTACLFVCEESSPQDCESFRLILDAPKDSAGNPIGERITVDFQLEPLPFSGEAKQALFDARDYIVEMPRSRQNLCDVIAFYCDDETAEAVVDWLGIDWAFQAERSIKEWQDTLSSYGEPPEKQAPYLTREYLYDMLTADGFTQSEAEAALDALEIK